MSDLRERNTVPTNPDRRQTIPGPQKPDPAALRMDRRHRDQPLVLSYAQERLWVLEQLQTVSSALTLSGTLRLQGELDIDALEASFRDAVRRHENLRTRYLTVDGLGTPMIEPRAEFRLTSIDLTKMDRRQREAAGDDLVLAQRELQFDLANGPLLRVCVIRLDDREHLVIVNVHRLIADNNSLQLLAGEVLDVYATRVAGLPSPLPDLPIQYVDYALWQRRLLHGDEFRSHVAYWTEHLAGAPPALTLPTDRPRPPAQTFRGTSVPLVLPAKLSRALSDLARREKVTLHMVLLAGFALLLSRYSSQQDIVVGVPTAGRKRRELKGLIGLFENTLPLRVDLSGRPSFCEFVQRVNAVAIEADCHDDMPFERLVEELQPVRDLSRHPLFQTSFALQNAATQSFELPGLKLEVSAGEQTTTLFDLAFLMRETPQGLRGTAVYATDLFDQSTVERMTRHFETLLAGAVSDPSRTIDDLTLLDEAEQRQIVVAWNETAADYPRDRCLHDLFSEQAARNPDEIALAFEGQYMTYGELDRRSNKLANYLRSLSVGPDVVVGLCIERSLGMVIGLLGILKAGGAYLPLDPGYPEERLAYMLEDARVAVLVTQDWLVERLPKHNARLVRLNANWQEIGQQPATTPDSGARGTNLAYVIYTSGSTGQPKGVMCVHIGIVNRLLWMAECYRLGPADRVLHKTPFSFDVSVWELFWPLISGTRLVLARPGGHLDPAYLASLIVKEGITVAHFLPSMLRTFLDLGVIDQCTSLREAFCGGETLPFELVRLFLSRSRARLTNVYGPTEASIGMTSWQGSLRPDGVVPIGRPIANMRAYVMNPASLTPVPIGIAGELYIGGVQLARGYLHKPALTAERFIPNPFARGERLYKTGDLARWLADGNLEFLGRIDHQVKLDGYRIELGEVEAALLTCPGVQHAVAVVRDDEPGGRRLVGYVVVEGTAPLNAAELRAHLKARLPHYMVPSLFVALHSLPVTPNGKIDRNALPAPKARSGRYVAPRDQSELILQRIWQQMLVVSPIGINDDFFELGGRSLLAASVVAACSREFAIELPLRALFDHPTIESLAIAIRKNAKPQCYRALVPLRAAGGRRALFCVHPAGGAAFRYMPLIHSLGPDQPVYGLQASGLEPNEPLATSLEAMAAEYIDAIRVEQPRGPYQLLGWSFGGLVAYEMAHQLQEAGERIALLALLDTPRPWSAATARLSETETVAALANQILGPQEQGEDDRGKLTSVVELVETARRRGSVSPDFALDQAERMAAVLANCIEIGRAYDPPRSHGDLMFFRATEQADSQSVPSEQFDWSPLLDRKPITIPVACTHLSMPSPRFAGIIADALFSRLDRIHDRVDLREPILMIVARQPNGWISTAELITELSERFEKERKVNVCGIIREMISRERTEPDVIRLGFVEHVDDGIRITELGRQFLGEMS
jgi:amino acid adenylation domain-containing protein